MNSYGLLWGNIQNTNVSLVRVIEGHRATYVKIIRAVLPNGTAAKRFMTIAVIRQGVLLAASLQPLSCTDGFAGKKKNLRDC